MILHYLDITRIKENLLQMIYNESLPVISKMMLPMN